MSPRVHLRTSQEAVQRAIQAVWRAVRHSERAAPFLELPSRADYPDYFTRIVRSRLLAWLGLEARLPLIPGTGLLLGPRFHILCFLLQNVPGFKRVLSWIWQRFEGFHYE